MLEKFLLAKSFIIYLNKKGHINVAESYWGRGGGGVYAPSAPSFLTLEGVSHYVLICYLALSNIILVRAPQCMTFLLNMLQ